MKNTNEQKEMVLEMDEPCSVNGKNGVIKYRTLDGWYGVQLEGELRIDEWQPCQVER